jgi:hypothetical protein
VVAVEEEASVAEVVVDVAEVAVVDEVTSRQPTAVASATSRARRSLSTKSEDLVV